MPAFFFRVVSLNAMAVTTKQVHIHLQEMSERYAKEFPNLSIARIAKDFGTTVEELQPHLERLKAFGLISHHGKSTSVVKLTEEGKLFNVAF